MSTCLGSWFVGNMISQNLISTGAHAPHITRTRPPTSRSSVHPMTPTPHLSITIGSEPMMKAELSRPRNRVRAPSVPLRGF